MKLGKIGLMAVDYSTDMILDTGGGGATDYFAGYDPGGYTVQTQSYQTEMVKDALNADFGLPVIQTMTPTVVETQTTMIEQPVLAEPVLPAITTELVAEPAPTGSGTSIITFLLIGLAILALARKRTTG